jgi:hypothetical protein
LLNPVDQLAFAIGLAEQAVELERVGERQAVLFDFLERGATVNRENNRKCRSNTA